MESHPLPEPTSSGPGVFLKGVMGSRYGFGDVTGLGFRALGMLPREWRNKWERAWKINWKLGL